MEYHQLGHSGLHVSALCLGAMMFGLRTNEATARRIIAIARESGVNFIDTADQYANGASEEILGRLLARDRDRWVLATKVGMVMEQAPNRSGLGHKWIMHQIEASLRRLRTDYVDIYYLHLDDLKTPIEETLFAVSEVLRSGKARYFGISNFKGWRIARVAELCDRMTMPRPVVCQPYYNAMNRMPEDEILPACAHYGIGVTPYSPVARGVLTGKYKPGAPSPQGSRAGRGDERIMETEFRAESIALAQTIKAHAESRGMTAGQFAVNWVLNNRLVDSVIVGPRTVSQWREYLAALRHQFTAEDEALVDRLVPPGHPSTPGYTDPVYPPLGRVPRTA